MGSTSIRDVGSLFGGLNVGAQDLLAGKISNNISTTEKSDSASFQSFLSNSSNAVDKDPKELKAANENKAEKPASKGKDTSDRIAGEDSADAGKTTATEKKQVEKDAADNEVKDDTVADGVRGKGLYEKSGFTDYSADEVIEAFSELAAAFLNQVSEILNITPEEAKDILADMNLEATDILDAANLSAFALRAMGAEDSLSLLTNETQFEQFQNVNDALQSLLSQQSPIEGLDVAGLKSLAEEQMTLIESSGVVVNEERIPFNKATDSLDNEEPMVTENTVDTEVETVAVSQGKEPDTDEKEVSRKTSSSMDQADRSALSQMTTSDGSTLGAEANMRASMRDGENSRRENRGNREGAGDNANTFQNPFREFVNTQVQGTESFANVQTPLTTMREIANQIMDYMRSQVKPDMQTLEMQLHPASLGNVQISLVHKDGNITANFACQDEQVRAVLENQMIQLQERFEEQGIKVTSIEVSVETHGFEQNLEQQGHRDEQQASQQPRRVRRLQLGPDFLQEDLESLEGDDRIAAEMMAANGGTMDVQV